MVHTNNFTELGIHTSTELHLWISFNFLVALSSLIGDTIILVGIIRYKAMKLHKAVVVVIIHLAVSDLLLTTFETVPQIISLSSQGWVLGGLLCLLNPNINIACITATAGLTCVLTTNKLLIVLHPLRAGSWTEKQVHMVCAVFWVLGLFQPGQLLYIFFCSSEDLYFNYLDYTCSYMQTDAPAWLEWSAAVFTFGGLLLAFIVLVLTSSLLLLKARKLALERGKCLRWQGVLTVVTTTVVYLVSNLPWFVVTLSSLAVSPSTSTWRAVLFISNLNIMANFYVYSLTVASFREFLCTSARQLAERVGVLTAPATAAEARRRGGGGGVLGEGSRGGVQLLDL